MPQNKSNLEDIGIVFAYIISCVIGNIAFYVVYLHHKNKPLGMQTFLSRVILMLIRVFSCGSVTIGVICVIANIYSPLNDFVSKSFALAGKLGQFHLCQVV